MSPKAKISALAVALVLVMIISVVPLLPSVTAQAGTITVTVNNRDASPQGMSGIVVKVTSYSGTYCGTTDANGVATFTGTFASHKFWTATAFRPGASLTAPCTITPSSEPGWDAQVAFAVVGGSASVTIFYTRFVFKVLLFLGDVYKPPMAVPGMSVNLWRGTGGCSPGGCVPTILTTDGAGTAYFWAPDWWYSFTISTGVLTFKPPYGGFWSIYSGSPVGIWTRTKSATYTISGVMVLS